MCECIPSCLLRYSDSTTSKSVIGGGGIRPQQQHQQQQLGGFLMLSPYNEYKLPSLHSKPNSFNNYPSADFLGFDDAAGLELKTQQDEQLNIKNDDDDDDEGFIQFNKGLELEEELTSKTRRRKREMMMKRSNMIAKQVITIHSASSLGFVSQLWIHPSSVPTFSFSYIFFLFFIFYHYHLHFHN